MQRYFSSFCICLTMIQMQHALSNLIMYLSAQKCRCSVDELNEACTFLCSSLNSEIPTRVHLLGVSFYKNSKGTCWSAFDSFCWRYYKLVISWLTRKCMWWLSSMILIRSVRIIFQQVHSENCVVLMWFWLRLTARAESFIALFVKDLPPPIQCKSLTLHWWFPHVCHAVRKSGKCSLEASKLAASFYLTVTS